jgi:toluene monooxygenase electron transfer component
MTNEARARLNARNQAFEFTVGQGESLLYAGLRQGIGLPYECATGTCGTCRAKVVAGSVKDIWFDAPGRRYLKSIDETLLCQCTALDDVTLQVAAFVHEATPNRYVPRKSLGIVRGHRRLTDDVIELQVALDRPWEYDAGQFAAVRVEGVPGYRGYSMVNFERRAELLTFAIKRKPGGAFTEWLFGSAPDGRSIELFGPLGKSTFLPEFSRNILIIAGGSGIAGMMSILECARQSDFLTRHLIHVFYGIRQTKDAFYLDQLSALLALLSPRLQISLAISEDAGTVRIGERYPQIQIEHGLVHEVAMRRMHGQFENLQAYVAGPPPAVEAAIRALLLDARLGADRICYDKFS